MAYKRFMCYSVACKESSSSYM
uniref:Uncharacterized protein n=1 Tax=Arundo donax TaxID=35708 RepID=A0A0A9BJY5_ARUDO